jgi:hypothetical protein
MAKLLLALAAAVLCSGCATRYSLPDSAAEVDFEAPMGKTGWGQYERTEFYPGATPERVRQQVIQGLSQMRFAILDDDPKAAMVIGEHGATLYDWNILFGVYWKTHQNGVLVRYHVEASKDVGFLGDKTQRDWITELHGRLRIAFER